MRVCVRVRSFIRSSPLFLPIAFLIVSHFLTLAVVEFIIQTKLTLNVCLCLSSAGTTGVYQHTRLGARILRLTEKTLQDKQEEVQTGSGHLLLWMTPVLRGTGGKGTA